MDHQTVAEAFSEFKFKIGDIVIHRASFRRGCVIVRYITQGLSGNFNRAYILATGPGDIKAFEIELEAPTEYSVAS